jgi:hypothetical protein
MVTSVKMADDYKRKLDRLRESLSRLDGDAVTLKDTLERAIDACLEEPDLMRSRKARVRYPLPEAEIRKIHDVATDWGVVTSEEDIDITLYGGRRRRRS